MTYPNSSDVSAGQPTAASQYNNLRKDALLNGNSGADSVYLGTLLASYAFIRMITYLPTNRVRINYDSTKPCAIVIDGYMLAQTANIDLPSGLFSGAAALWYIFAVRTPSSSTFTLAVSTSAAPAPGQRLIGEVYWDGTNLAQNSMVSYYGSSLPIADYDSGWFPVVYNSTYTKPHGLGQTPRLVQLYHSTSPTGGAQNNLVTMVGSVNSPKCPIGIFDVNIVITTGTDSTNGTLLSTHGASAGGYYRVLAWK